MLDTPTATFSFMFSCLLLLSFSTPTTTTTTKRWEQWVLRIVVNNTPRPIHNDTASVIERQRIQDTAESMLRSVLFRIFEIAGGPMDHIPPVQYEFEISCSKRADDREHMYSRMANMPPILNLSH
jgi:hypothetical protein